VTYFKWSDDEKARCSSAAQNALIWHLTDIPMRSVDVCLPGEADILATYCNAV
jgi:hypothetical protein